MTIPAAATGTIKINRNKSAFLFPVLSDITVPSADVIVTSERYEPSDTCTPARLNFSAATDASYTVTVENSEIEFKLGNDLCILKYFMPILILKTIFLR